MFVNCNGPRKKVDKRFFLEYFFGPRCVFYACFTLIGSAEKTLG